MRPTAIALVMLACCCPLQAAGTAAVQAPDQLVRDTATATMAEIRERSDEFGKYPDHLYQLVEERLVPHFDVDMICRQVLGRHWNQATPVQRERFASAFRRTLVRTYAKALLAFKDDRFEWPPASPEPGSDDVVVRSTVSRSNGPSLSVNYRMRNVEGRWLVHDVTIDGISFVTNYRGIFNSEIRKHDLDTIIQRLEQKAAS